MLHHKPYQVQYLVIEELLLRFPGAAHVLKIGWNLSLVGWILLRMKVFKAPTQVTQATSAWSSASLT